MDDCREVEGRSKGMMLKRGDGRVWGGRSLTLTMTRGGNFGRIKDVWVAEMWGQVGEGVCWIPCFSR